MSSTESIDLGAKLIELFGQAGVLYVAIWFLVKILKSQYDSRITALENASMACENDRRGLHEMIQKMQAERIERLESQASKN